MVNHIILLGDSIFDNASYVGPTGKPIIDYLNRYLSENNRATLLAEDGATISDVKRQAEQVPKDGTHIFLSIGGNNIRRYTSFLEQTDTSVLKVLNTFYEIRESFEIEYFVLLEELKEIGIPFTVCTIYNCSFEGEERQRVVEVALVLFNDAIIRSAYRLSVPYIELRDVCNEPSDYVSNIEPSDSGGRKIAEVIAKKVI